MKTSRFLFAAIGLVLVLSSCSWFLPEPGAQPDLVVFAATQALPRNGTYHFGDVAVGTSSTAQFTLKNEGGSDLHLAETGTIVIIIRSVQTEAPFAVTSSASVIPAGGSAPFSITFAPQSVGAFSTVVSISSDDPDGAYELTMTGQGVPEEEPGPEPEDPLTPDINIPDVAIDGVYNFGKVALGATTTKAFTARNEGNAVLHVSSVSVEEPFVADVVPFSVGPGETATFTVAFTLSDYGSVSATVTVVSNDPDEGEYRFTVGAMGVDVVYAPAETWKLSVDTVSVSHIASDGAGNVYVASILALEDTPLSYSYGVTKFGETGAVVWEHVSRAGGSLQHGGFTVSPDGVVYRSYSAGNPLMDERSWRVECLGALTGESVWEVESSWPRHILLDPTGSYLYVFASGDGTRYDAVDGSIVDTWSGIEETIGSFAADGEYFYYSGSVRVSSFSTRGVWVRRSYNLSTYEWFWDLGEDDELVNGVPHGGIMALGSGMLYGVNSRGINGYDAADGERLWAVPITFPDDPPHHPSLLAGGAIGDGLDSLYVVYQTMDTDFFDVVGRHLIKVIAGPLGGEVIWDIPHPVFYDRWGFPYNQFVFGVVGNVLIVIGEQDNIVRRFSTLNGSEIQ